MPVAHNAFAARFPLSFDVISREPIAEDRAELLRIARELAFDGCADRFIADRLSDILDDAYAA